MKDLQSGELWFFVCENWLAVEFGDGKVCRVHRVASDEERTNFGHLFSAHTAKGLMDEHIWISIAARPPTSSFTRVQRLSCALCLMCCTMITSAMFYSIGGDGASQLLIHIGSLVIHLKPFIIGLQSSVIILPVNVAVVQIFRNLKPKAKKEYGDTQDINSLEDGDIHGERVGQMEEKRQASNGRLPYWFTFIAYALCYVASAASVFFTLLYSIEWGSEKSTEWVISMVVSFFQSVLILQPMKVVIAAVIVALIIRKPCDSEEDSDDKHIVEKTEESAMDGKQKLKTRNHPDYR